IACMRAGKVSEYYTPLLRIGNDCDRPNDLRVAALAVALPQIDQMNGDVFTFLRGCMAGDQPPLLRLAAAEALGKARLTSGQLQTLGASVADAGPLEIGHLVAAFEQTDDPRAGRILLKSLDKAPGLASLAPRTLRDAVRLQPEGVRRDADALLKRFDVD